MSARRGLGFTVGEFSHYGSAKQPGDVRTKLIASSRSLIVKMTISVQRFHLTAGGIEEGTQADDRSFTCPDWTDDRSYLAPVQSSNDVLRDWMAFA